ncbi:MAG: sel1 repeat family protein [Chromatiaceae bacterium]|nr:sel1 repeat family protein [Chromatiaceae bacterium]MCF8014735.1 sel1 repeat family protein [Chromatiaceae bacterium]
MTRRFRCCECGHLFVAQDAFLIRLGLLSALGAISVVAALYWGYSRQPWMTPDSGESVSRIVRRGVGVEGFGLDPAAHQGFEQAALAGDSEAQYQIGVRLVKQAWQLDQQFKLVDGINWVRKAADAGHHQAQAFLGRSYEKGRGVIQDHAQAYQWYQRSSFAGNPMAMLRLGKLLADGRGVEVDVIQAYQWLNLAAARGLYDAERERERLQIRMSVEDLVAAQDASRHFDQNIPRLSVEFDDWPPGF